MSRPLTKSPPVQFRLPIALYADLEAIAAPATPSQWVESHLIRLLTEPEVEHEPRTIQITVNGAEMLTIHGSLAVNLVNGTEKAETVPVVAVTDLIPDVSPDLAAEAAASVRLDGDTRSFPADPACEHRKSVLIAGGMRKCPDCKRLRRPDGHWYSV